MEHASDAQFLTWVEQNGIPVDNEAGITAWDFEERCLLINHLRFYGVWSSIQFPIEISPESAQNGTDVNVPDSGELAPDAG